MSWHAAPSDPMAGKLVGILQLDCTTLLVNSRARLWPQAGQTPFGLSTALCCLPGEKPLRDNSSLPTSDHYSGP
jgi:hypothetical protein